MKKELISLSVLPTSLILEKTQVIMFFLHFDFRECLKNISLMDAT